MPELKSGARQQPGFIVPLTQLYYSLTIDSLTLQLEDSSLNPFSYKYIADNYSISGNTYICTSSLKLRKTQKLEKYYLHAFEVWIDDCKVGMLSTDCRQPGQAASIKFSFENEMFYTLPGWFYYLRLLEQHLPLRFRSISYIEIAYDFQPANPFLPELCQVYRYSSFLKDNTEVLFGPLDGKTTCTPHDGKLYAFGHSVNGRNATGRQIVAYGKSFELDKGHKDYILAHWLANGLDPERPTERIEAKLSAKWLSKFSLAAFDLTNPKRLNWLFREAVGTTFTFRKLSETYYDANRNKKTATVALIRFSDLDAEPLYAKPISSNMPLNNDCRNRTEVKNIIFRYIDKGNEQDLAQLHYIQKNVSCPPNKSWPLLFSGYAQQFDGRTTPDRLSRIDLFG